MARSLNKVQLIGNLGADPEVRHFQDGRSVANLRVATSDTWNDAQGQRQEKTEWHRVSIYGKLADIAAQYLRKGSKVFLEGSLQTRKWTDKQGLEQYTTEIILSGFNSNLMMLDGKTSGADGFQGGGYSPSSGGGYSPDPASFQPSSPQQDFSPPPHQPMANQPRQPPSASQPQHNEFAKTTQDFDDDIPF